MNTYNKANKWSTIQVVSLCIFTIALGFTQNSSSQEQVQQKTFQNSGVAKTTTYTENQGRSNDINQKNKDSTKIRLGKNGDSICISLDGVPIDGSPGTPQTSPYNGGNWYASLNDVSTAFGGRSISRNGGACITNCPVNTKWNGTNCAAIATCTPSTSTKTSPCGNGYNGGLKSNIVTVTCPTGPTGAPVTSVGSDDLSSCIACPSPNDSQFTPVCTGTDVAVPNSGLRRTTYSCTTGVAIGSTATINNGICNPAPATCKPDSQLITAPCGSGLSGTKTATRTTTCPSGPFGPADVKVSSYDTSMCTATCVAPSPEINNFTPSCPSNYTVSKMGQTRTTYNCVSGTVTGSTVVIDPGACQENPQTCFPTTDSSACPTGYSGTRSRVSSCATKWSTPTWSSWDTSNCVLEATCTTGSESLSCGSGYSGGTKTRNSTCTTPYSSPVWGAWDMSGCLACPGNSTSNFTPSCPANYTAVAGSGIQTTSYNCSSGSAVGSTSTTYAGDCIENAQTCWPSTDSAACDPGYTGTKTRSSSCATKWSSPVWGGWDTSSCTPAAPSTCTFSEYNLNANRVTYTLKTATVGLNGKFTWCDGGTNNLGRWHLCGAGGTFTSGTEVNTSCKTAY